MAKKIKRDFYRFMGNMGLGGSSANPTHHDPNRFMHS
jgi:hypothetical protein